MKIFTKTFLFTLILCGISLSLTKNDTTYVRKEFFIKGIINEKLSNYQLKVINAGLFVNKEYYYTIYRFILLDTLDYDTLSTSSMKKFQLLDNEEYDLVDINFDGYKDLKILYDYSANGLNTLYRILLFNKTNNKFEYNAKVSELLGANCIIDSINKEIYTYNQSFSSGRPSSFSETYKFVNNNLVLIKETGFYFIDSTDAETGKDLYRDYEKVRKDTSLIFTKDHIIKYNYGEK